MPFDGIFALPRLFISDSTASTIDSNEQACFILHHSFENFTVSATIFIIPRCAQTDKRKILCEVFL